MKELVAILVFIILAAIYATAYYFNQRTAAPAGSKSACAGCRNTSCIYQSNLQDKGEKND